MLQFELDAPWINSTLKNASRCRDAAKGKAIRTKNPLDWASYRELRNKIDKVLSMISCTTSYSEEIISKAGAIWFLVVTLNCYFFF